MADTSKMSEIEFTRWLAGCDPETGKTLHPGDVPIGDGDEYWRKRCTSQVDVIVRQQTRIRELEAELGRQSKRVAELEGAIAEALECP